MKKEIIGYVGDYNDNWCFKTEEESYGANVTIVIEELLGIYSKNGDLLGIYSKDGDKFKITIEKLN